jgi:catechol 2,3-dioxygenase-like lactoylglutathione lyase family enzyme
VKSELSRPHISGAHHFGFSVRDLDRSIRLYCDVLGAGLVRPPYGGDNPSFAGRMAIVSLGATGLDLFEHARNGGEGVKTMSAAFDAGYAEAMGMVMYTEADVVLMIRPLDRRSSGIIACTACSGPQKLTWNARRYSVMLAASITPRAASTPRC